MTKQVFALPCLALVVAASAGAQTQTPSRVGVIQIQSALIGTKDGQKAAADLETRMAPKKKEMDRKRAELQDLQDKLSRGGNAMAEAAKAELTRTIDQKTKAYNRDMEDAQAELDQEQRKILEELQGKLTQVIDKYAQANNFAVILDVSSQNTPVMYASTAVDITKDIIDLYDKSVPTTPTAKPLTPTPTNTKPPTPTPTTTKPAATTPAPVKKQP